MSVLSGKSAETTFAESSKSEQSSTLKNGNLYFATSPNFSCADCETNAARTSERVINSSKSSPASEASIRAAVQRSLHEARKAIVHSGQLSATNAILSPALTPALTSALAYFSTFSNTCPYV